MRRYAVVIFIVLLALGIRIYNLTTSPDGLYIDETSIGYNAFSLLKTGMDEHGRAWPLFFEAFGEWKLPIYIYSVFYFQLLFGAQDFTVRLPAVLYGAGTVVAIFFLCEEIQRRIKKEHTLLFPALASFFLATSPWHFQFTHAGFEASSGVFFLVVGVWLFLRAVRTQSSATLVSAGISFVLTLYSYNSARIVTPVLVGILFLLHFNALKWKQWLISFCIASILAIPFLFFSFSPAGLVRAQQVGVFYQRDGKNPWQEVFSNYFTNLNVNTLFTTGEPTIANMSPHRFGLVNIIEFPGLIAGLFFLIRAKKRIALLIFVWLVIGFVPPALTTLNPHALRGVLVVPALVIMAGYGYAQLVALMKNRPIQIGIMILLLFLHAGATIRFLQVYHQLYTRDSGWDWQVDIKRAAAEIKQLENDYQHVIIQSPGAGRISFLWYLGISPRLYHASEDKNSIDRYIFTNAIGEEKFTQSLYVHKAKLKGYTVVKTIRYPNDQVAYYLLSN